MVMINRGDCAWELCGDVVPRRPKHLGFGRERASPKFAGVADGGGLSGVLQPVGGGVPRDRELLALGQNEGIHVVAGQRSGCRHGRKNDFHMDTQSYNRYEQKCNAHTHYTHTYTHAVNPASQNNNVEKSSSNLAPHRTTVGK